MVYTHTCEICGKVFKTKYVQKLTCSPECNAERSSRYMRNYAKAHKGHIKARRHAYYVKHRDPNTAVRKPKTEHGKKMDAKIMAAITGGGVCGEKGLSMQEILEVERVYKTVPAINRWPIVSKWKRSMREYLRILCKDNYGKSAREYIENNMYDPFG